MILKFFIIGVTCLCFFIQPVVADDDVKDETFISNLDIDQADIHSVLALYEQFSGCELVVSSDVLRLKTVINLNEKNKSLSNHEASILIQKALLEQAGVVLTPLKTNEVSVTYNDALIKPNKK